MRKNLVDEIALLKNSDPDAILKQFHNLFETITDMKFNELVAAKQAIDLTLKLCGSNFDSENQITILAIVKAMQSRARLVIEWLKSTDRSILGELLYINPNYPFFSVYDFEFSEDGSQINPIYPPRENIETNEIKGSFLDFLFFRIHKKM